MNFVNCNQHPRPEKNVAGQVAPAIRIDFKMGCKVIGHCPVMLEVKNFLTSSSFLQSLGSHPVVDIVQVDYINHWMASQTL